MMKEFEIIPYTKPDDSSPVKEFILSLPAKMQAKALMEMDLLRRHRKYLEMKLNLLKGIARII